MYIYIEICTNPVSLSGLSIHMYKHTYICTCMNVCIHKYQSIISLHVDTVPYVPPFNASDRRMQIDFWKWWTYSTSASLLELCPKRKRYRLWCMRCSKSSQFRSWFLHNSNNCCVEKVDISNYLCWGLWDVVFKPTNCMVSSYMMCGLDCSCVWESKVFFAGFYDDTLSHQCLIRMVMVSPSPLQSLPGSSGPKGQGG